MVYYCNTRNYKYFANMLKRRIFRVFIIVAGIAVFQVLGTIILARNLGKSEVGLYRLILSIIEVAVIGSLAGIDQSLVRFFSSPNIFLASYNWAGFVKRFFLAISLPVVVLLALILGLTYKLGFPGILFIILSSSVIVLILILASFLRSTENYEIAVFFSRMHFLLFFLFICGLLLTKNLSYTLVLSGYILSLAASVSISVYYCLKYLPQGSEKINLSVVKNGLYYFGIGLAIMSIINMGNLFIGKLLSYRDLAIYAVIASLMRLFEFVQVSSYHVLAPYFNRQKRIPVGRIIFSLAVAAVAIAVFYLSFGSLMVHYLFKGNYDEGIYLIPLFVAAGLLRTLYVMPASIIGGKCSQLILRRQFFVCCLVAAINAVLNMVLIRRFRLTGAALANLLSWALLLIASLFGTRNYYRNG